MPSGIFLKVAGVSLAWLAVAGAVRGQVEATPRGSSAVEHLARAREAFSQARYSEAESALREASRLAPSDAGIWVQLGQARYAQKNWDAALEAFDRALALRPDDSQVLTSVGVCAHGRGALPRARAAFEKALELEPKNSRAHLFLARIEWSEGRGELAEKGFRSALAASPVEPIAAHYFGLFLYEARRFEDARRAFEAALKLMPDHPASLMHLGLVLERTGEREKSRACLERFQQLQQLSVSDHKLKLKLASLFEAARRDMEAGHFEAALTSALAARELADDLPAVHALLQRIYELVGRPEDAEREAARARELAAGRR